VDMGLLRSRFPAPTCDGIPGALFRLRRTRSPSIACTCGARRLHGRRRFSGISFACGESHSASASLPSIETPSRAVPWVWVTSWKW